MNNTGNIIRLRNCLKLIISLKYIVSFLVKFNISLNDVEIENQQIK